MVMGEFSFLFCQPEQWVKMFGCILTLLSTAVQPIVVHSLTTKTFVLAFQKINNRRRAPEKVEGHQRTDKVYNGNETNLVGGQQELQRCLQ